MTVADLAGICSLRGPDVPTNAGDQRRRRLDDHRNDIDAVIESYLPHPFEQELCRANAPRVAEHFLGISTGFPYALAGSQRAILEHLIRRNEGPDPCIERTSAVANFLNWDEVGGNSIMLKLGMAGLPSILDTKRNFHANLLQHDLSRIVGTQVQPDFAISGPYLMELCTLFAEVDGARRCAAFVSFERHAELVITQLWNRLKLIYGLGDKSNYPYFETHIGDSDPGEQYHVQLTERLLHQVATEDCDGFLRAFDASFRSHIEWSRDICRQ